MSMLDAEDWRRAVRSREHLVPERQDVSSTDKFIVSQIVGAIPNPRCRKKCLQSLESRGHTFSQWKMLYPSTPQADSDLIHSCPFCANLWSLFCTGLFYRRSTETNMPAKIQNVGPHAASNERCASARWYYGGTAAGCSEKPGVKRLFY